MERSAVRRRRGLSSDEARVLRQRGHNDAREFAMAIQLPSDYRNDIRAKKDVIDPSGDSHSVKGGDKKWQVFLYSRGRFDSDDSFRAMNGIGDLLLACIDAFPESFDDYQRNKTEAKERLREPMKQLAERLQDRTRLRAFLNKSLFNGGEVNYLTAKHNNLFHVFWGPDVIRALNANLEVCNSRAISAGQFPEQKVLFRYHGTNLGELEMRNDSPVHYREIRFNMIKPKIMELLFAEIPHGNRYNRLVCRYGYAVRHFGRW